MDAEPGRGVRGTLVVFAREPLPGRVKSRLIPALGAEGAVRLYRYLLDLALEVAIGVSGVGLELWCEGAVGEGSHCAELAHRHGLSLHRQPEGDLGRRMETALAQALRHGPCAVLIGSDCPQYTLAYLASAFAALDDAEVVLGPAADGGYVLIGLRRGAPELFRGIPWGTDRVLEATRAALRRLGWTWTELPTLRDLDRPEDLRSFPRLGAEGRG